MAVATRKLQKFKLVFNVPISSLEACKAAIFAAGAGRYPSGNYTECCFTTFGTGQFRAGDKANPNIGVAGGNVEQVESAKVETLCVGEDVVRNAIESLKSAHPYEEPSCDVYKLEDF